MDHNSKSHHQNNLGVNKLGKNIRKSPLHQSGFQKFPTAAIHQQQPIPSPQPQVYNISKSDFRSVVQQLTGSPARDANGAGYPSVSARPPQPKHPSSRLMKIRPPPLNPIARPPPPPFQNQLPNTNPNTTSNLNPNPAFSRSAPSPSAPVNAVWTDSPVSAYMRYLESSLLTSDGSRQPQPRSQCMLPFPHPRAASADAVTFPSPRGNPHFASPQAQLAFLPGPGSQFPLLSPGSQFPFPSPGSQFPLPSPNSQFPLISPSSFLNLFSPKPLHSPRFQYPTPITPNFSFSPLPQSGLLGPGPGYQPPSSPILLFPPSPSGFLPLLSPGWREM